MNNFDPGNIRWRPRGSLAAFLVVLLAACGGGPAPASAPASSPAAAASKPAAASPAASPSASAKPAVAASATAASPAVSASAAAAGTPIKIGYITDLTGSTAQFGKDGLDAFNLYWESVNNTVAGRKLEVIAADDQIKADVGVTKARQLVESDKVHLIAGILNSAVCYALAEYAKSAQVPLAVTAGCAAQFFASDPRFSSAYVSRFTNVPMALADPLADWAYKQGMRKAGVIAIDQPGGLEPTDVFAAAFVKRGGSIVQELHPPFPSNADFGPYLAQLDPSMDALMVFEPGIDGLRFAQQFQNYGGQRKPKVLDFYGLVTDATNLPQLKDAAAGIVIADFTDLTSTSPAYQTMAKAWKAKYPDRPLSARVIQAYASGQIVAAAIQKVNGNVEQKQQFADALLATDMETVKGPVKVDKTHEIIQNTHIFEIVKQPDGSFGPKLLQTYPLVPPMGSFTFEEVQRLKPGSNKGKWPGFTKAQLDQVLAAPSK